MAIVAVALVLVGAGFAAYRYSGLFQTNFMTKAQPSVSTTSNKVAQMKGGLKPSAPIVAVCGNNKIEGGEACDGTDLGGKTCDAMVKGAVGTLACNGRCAFNVSGCHVDPCVQNPCQNGGVCSDSDGTAVCACAGNWAGATCTACEPGFTGADCHPVPVCGNGKIEMDESCDDGNTLSGDGCSSACALEQGWDCVGAPSVCKAVCGDGVINGSEVCDGTNFGGKTCATEKGADYTKGSLSCLNGCATIDVSKCSK
jgi:cysteine-rich repeat protein